MKCKTFKIYLEENGGETEETKLNKFLENLNVSQIFSSLVNNEFWSVLVFYDDNFSLRSHKTENPASISDESFAPKTSAEKSPKSEIVASEPIVLNHDEEKIYAALREWRNEQAAGDGLPPYMIAHNDSLMLMAKNSPESLEELVQIKGFGEKRAQKYADEILQIISRFKSDST